MLEAAYESDEITSEYLKYICFKVSKCKTEDKSKRIVLGLLTKQKQKAKGSSITSISMDSPIPKKGNQKEIWKRKDRATLLLLKCQTGTSTKIDHSDASTLFQAAKIVDEDRKLEPS